nr:unnamed protein product [Haemonchus contortus]
MWCSPWTTATLRGCHSYAMFSTGCKSSLRRSSQADRFVPSGSGFVPLHEATRDCSMLTTCIHQNGSNPIHHISPLSTAYEGMTPTDIEIGSDEE